MKAIYIPNGPKNLASLFPTVDFKEVAEYFITLKDQNDAILVSGTVNVLETCVEDYVRLHFLNSLGTIDAINFQIVNIENDTKADSYERPTSYPLEKSQHAINRFNVKSNSVYTVRTADYYEEHMEWLEELQASPLAWIEWKGIQGQPDSYLPIVIVDQKQVKRKEDDRYVYEVTMQFRLSHERFNIRN